VDDRLILAVEMNERIWARFASDVAELTAAEASWRPLPGANSIELILRHLRIEAEWHLASLQRGEAMPTAGAADVQEQIDSVSLGFEQNLNELGRLFSAYVAVLKEMSLASLAVQTGRAYGGGADIPAHFLGFHQATHLAAHLGQIRAIRNLYSKTRGEAALFHPSNPTYPR